MREPTTKELADLKHRHDHHAPSVPAVARAHNAARALTTQYCASMLALLPEKCRETSLFLTKMDEARMWANSAIACNQPAAPVVEWRRYKSRDKEGVSCQAVQVTNANLAELVTAFPNIPAFFVRDWICKDGADVWICDPDMEGGFEANWVPCEDTWTDVIVTMQELANLRKESLTISMAPGQIGSPAEAMVVLKDMMAQTLAAREGEATILKMADPEPVNPASNN